ncbi:MAG: hypothetical protein JWQ89_253 [Devosia sp.]|uniref:alpha/beta fold hydrolase n=1 Tax=Devosia sp. TaxID=1871048 RepID=UPI002629E322|nr:alpha/beta hydrolase [Devosia sp.]MDB5538526.1 hypothetical protein [Devosia sp.]
MSARSQTVTIGDLEVHYLEEGRGQPLILLHGGTATAESWGEAMPTMADRYRVFALDTRGHGKTSNPAQKLSYAQFADDVAGFIAALGLRKPLIVGYSDGGQTALEFGLRHPGKAGALVLGGTVSQPSEIYMEGLHGWGFPAPGEVDFERLAREFGPYFEQIKLAHAHHYGPDYWRSFLRQISELWLTLPSYSERQLASISVPALVIMGDRDQLGGVEEAHRLYRHLGAGELSIIANVGHEVVNRPLFWDAVREFLARHDSREG